MTKEYFNSLGTIQYRCTDDAAVCSLLRHNHELNFATLCSVILIDCLISYPRTRRKDYVIQLFFLLLRRYLHIACVVSYRYT